MSYITYERSDAAVLQNGTAASLVSYILIGCKMINPYVSNWTSRAKRCGAIRGGIYRRIGYQVDLQVVAEKKSSSERVVVTKMHIEIQRLMLTQKMRAFWRPYITLSICIPSCLYLHYTDWPQNYFYSDFSKKIQFIIFTLLILFLDIYISFYNHIILMAINKYFLFLSLYFMDEIIIYRE